MPPSGERRLSRAVLAAAAGMSTAELALAFKDQRELSAAEVAVFAEFAGRGRPRGREPGRRLDARAGAGRRARISALERRVAVLEAEQAQLHALASARA